MYRDAGLGLDYITVSKELSTYGCVERCKMIGNPDTREGYFGSDHSPVVMRLVDNWVQLADDRGAVSNIAEVDDDVFESTILSRLELEAKPKESDLYEALMEEQAALNFLACVTTMSSAQTMQKPKMPEHVQHYAANRHGYLHVNDVPIECEVLMDSGASHTN